MCGRYTLKTPAEELAQVFELAVAPSWSPRFNVAPIQLGLVVAADARGRRAGHMRWGLRPAWAAAEGPAPINARAETLADKPMFRKAFARRRCVALLDGFFEWRPATGGADLFGVATAAGRHAAKQPMYIRRRDGAPFAVAALWEPPPTPDAAATFALVTTTTNALLATIHDRMPVVLAGDAIAQWLAPAPVATLAPLLQPSPPAWWECWPVSARINAPGDDDAGLLAAIGPVERSA